MRNAILRVLGVALLFVIGYFLGQSRPLVAHAQSAPRGGIPKAYGHLVGAVVNPSGTAMVFEDSAGVIRFVTIDGKLEAELTRN